MGFRSKLRLTVGETVALALTIAAVFAAGVVFALRDKAPDAPVASGDEVAEALKADTLTLVQPADTAKPKNKQKHRKATKRKTQEPEPRHHLDEPAKPAR